MPYPLGHVGLFSEGGIFQKRFRTLGVRYSQLCYEFILHTLYLKKDTKMLSKIKLSA